MMLAEYQRNLWGRMDSRVNNPPQVANLRHREAEPQSGCQLKLAGQVGDLPHI
jgi:hypothetical protein